jgi:hypothetical protein
MRGLRFWLENVCWGRAGSDEIFHLTAVGLFTDQGCCGLGAQCLLKGPECVILRIFPEFFGAVVVTGRRGSSFSGKRIEGALFGG